MEMSLGPVSFAPEVAVVFPATRCCNCGATGKLSIREQDTKKTNYLLFAGTELTFKLPLPVCKRCRKSLRRRVPTLLHKFLLLFVVAFVLFLLAVTVGANVLQRVPAISNHLFPFCLLSAFVLLWAFYAARRPRGNQTSYYQPVRLGKLKRGFVSGDIQGVGLRFTNLTYLRDFQQLNKAVIQSGHVLAERA